MRDALRTALRAVHDCVDQIDAARITTDEAAELLEIFVALERAAAGGKLLVAGRAADGRTWIQSGHRSAAHWLAELGRTGMGDAIGTLETADRLGDLPETTKAVRRGELSSAQVRVIADAGRVDPSVEQELLEAAATKSFKAFKDRARRVKAAAAAQLSESEREDHVRRTRYLRSWTDDEGALRLDARLTPVDGALVLAGLEAQAKMHFEQAQAAGVCESESAYLADALVSLCASSSDVGKAAKGKGPRAVVHLRVDLAALRRGWFEPGEVCEIPGVGTVSLATARDLIGDSFVKLLVTDGIDIQTVAHYGRTIPAAIRSALEERDPTCVVPGCSATKFLEIDHWDIDFARGGQTAMWNLARICPHHHQLKTRGEFELVGGPGYWQFRRVKWDDANRPPPSAEGPPPLPGRSCAEPLPA